MKPIDTPSFGKKADGGLILPAKKFEGEFWVLCDDAMKAIHYERSKVSAAVREFADRVAERVESNAHKLDCLCGACQERKMAAEIIRKMAQEVK